MNIKINLCVGSNKMFLKNFLNKLNNKNILRIPEDKQMYFSCIDTTSQRFGNTFSFNGGVNQQLVSLDVVVIQSVHRTAHMLSRGTREVDPEVKPEPACGGSLMFFMSPRPVAHRRNF